jgi:hypothetical protein
MRTVAEILSSGIESVADLQESLNLAAKLEFSTIPLHLCAEWSIKAAEDPDHVAKMIHNVVMQETLHNGLALNMLVAIGGQRAMANQDFVPSYPPDGLPENVHAHLVVDLLPFGTTALEGFLRIELPAHPIALAEIFPKTRWCGTGRPTPTPFACRRQRWLLRPDGYRVYLSEALQADASRFWFAGRRPLPGARCSLFALRLM